MRSKVEISQPAELPVSLDEVKKFILLRAVDTEDDDLLVSLTKSATKWAENFTRRQFVQRDLKLTLDTENFVDEEFVNLGVGMTLSVTSLTFYDNDNAAILWDSGNYFVDLPGNRIVFNENLPTTRKYSSLEIEFSAGYGTADDVPNDIKQAILLYVRSLHENRKGKIKTDENLAPIPPQAKQILHNYILHWGISCV